MNIDKFYRFVGNTLKSIFKKTVEKPIKNFNVENRAHRKIEQPKKAPWHPTTQKMINDLKKGFY